MQTPPTPQTPPAPEAERPLSRQALTLLMLSATAVIVLYYPFAFLALVFVTTLLLIDAALVLFAQIVGEGYRMTSAFRAQSRLAAQLLRSLNLARGPEWGLVLQPEDAPRLHQMVEQIARRVGAPLPNVTVLEMDAGASVLLRGYGRGRGHCRLALGFDLLLALTEAQAEAVVAHEMAHAKLIQRGYQGWLVNCIMRIGRFGSALSDEVEEAREYRHSRFRTAEWLLAMVDRFAKTGFRLLGTYSRQEEFAADRIAAELCGPETFRSALLATRLGAYKSADIDWRDRIVRLQREGSFTEWLRERLAPKDDAERQELLKKAFDVSDRSEYDTHPVMPDRLAALAGLPEAPAPSAATPAIDLLVEPDRLAERLISHLEIVAGEQERKESDQLRAQVRKSIGRPANTGARALGTAMVVLGAGGLVLLLVLVLTLRPNASDLSTVLGVIAFITAMLVLGSLVLYYSGVRERIVLPIPPLARWETSLEQQGATAPDPARLQAIEAELRAGTPMRAGNRRALAKFWGERCYEALRQCDYERAWVASGICLEADPERLEGLLARGITAAYYDDDVWLSHSFGMVVHKYGLGRSVSWAMGWAAALVRNWNRAEGYLLDAVTRRPREAALWAILAICQRQREKVHEAMGNARRAVELAPDAVQYRVVLSRMQLAAGRPLDAQQELEAIRGQADEEFDVLLGWVRVDLLLGRVEEAARRATLIQQLHPSYKTLMYLGRCYMAAEMRDEARSYLTRVVQDAFYPDALLGLAHMAYVEKDYPTARTHLQAALDLTRRPGPGASKPLELLPMICQALLAMGEPVEGCSAWTASVDMQGSPSGLARLDLLICAKTFAAAQAGVRWIYGAMHPGVVLPDHLVKWEPAPRDSQPQKAVPPGIYDQHAVPAEGAPR